MAISEEQLREANLEIATDLRLVHSVETPVEYEELETYGTAMVEHYSSLSSIFGDPVREMVSSIAAGAFFEDYALPASYPKLYAATDEFVRFGIEHDILRDHLEDVYTKLGGGNESIHDKHPAVYLLDRVMDHAIQTRNDSMRKYFADVRRRVLQMADSLLDLD